RPDTNEDTLSLGIITPSFDAVLARIDSFRDSSKPGDYMQLEINGGKIYMKLQLRLKGHYDWRHCNKVGAEQTPHFKSMISLLLQRIHK
ncbi:Neurexin3like, partial [Caligus rogercresseyi]